MTYQLGSADFDPSTGEVRTETGTTRLPRKAAVLLEALVERQGDVLTRDEIRDLLWPGGRVEFDQGINFLIRTIRRALDESARSPRFIETLPKRGYRFIAPVSTTSTAGAKVSGPGPETDAPTCKPISELAPEATPPIPSEPRKPTARRALAWIVAIAISGVLAFTVLSFPESPPPDTRQSPASSSLPLLAIIPLADQDAAPEAEAGARAVAEALTTDFTTTLDTRWRILGPAATRDIVSDGAEALAARARLDACLVLSGSVRTLEADTVVLFLQVIRTSDQAHLWARMDTTTIDDMVRAALESAGTAQARLEDEGDPAATECPA